LKNTKKGGFAITNDSMKITHLTPEAEILRELGRRLATVRKQQGLSQAKLAQEAGVGVATLRRIEAGKDGQLASWIKISKSLNMIAAIDMLMPEKFQSPMRDVLSQPKGKLITGKQLKSLGWGDEKE
jgi:transcriptional regulator with XRE-family HTH domain